MFKGLILCCRMHASGNMLNVILISCLLSAMLLAVSADAEFIDGELEELREDLNKIKRSSDSYCARCLTSDDWLSCFKCLDRPGHTTPYYGKKKRYWAHSDMIKPYLSRNNGENNDDTIFPGERKLPLQKRISDTNCHCCFRMGFDICCKSCNAFAGQEIKRGYGYETSFVERENDACSCCDSTSQANLLCCLLCDRKK